MNESIDLEFVYVDGKMEIRKYLELVVLIQASLGMKRNHEMLYGDINCN